MNLAKKLKENRIERLHSDLLCNAEKYPQIRFAATGLQTRLIRRGIWVPRFDSGYLRGLGDEEGCLEAHRKWIEAFTGINSTLVFSFSDDPTESFEEDVPIDELERKSGIRTLSNVFLGNCGKLFDRKYGLWFCRLAIQGETDCLLMPREQEHLSENDFHDSEELPDESGSILYSDEPFRQIESAIRLNLENLAAIIDKSYDRMERVSFDVWFTLLVTVFESRVRETQFRITDTDQNENATHLGWTLNLPWNFFLSTAVALEAWSSDIPLAEAVEKQLEELNQEKERLRTRSFLPSELTDRLEIYGGTLRKYAKACQVDVPKGPGDTKFRYPFESVKKICLYIDENSSNTKTIESARRLIQELEANTVRREI